MSKTIKIIDLLNKIANGEEPPEKIRIAGHRYKYNKETKDYDSDIGFDNNISKTLRKALAGRWVGSRIGFYARGNNNGGYAKALSFKVIEKQII